MALTVPLRGIFAQVEFVLYMAPKTKVVLAGLGLIGLNAFVFAMLALWPAGVTVHEARSPVSATNTPLVLPGEAANVATSTEPQLGELSQQQPAAVHASTTIVKQIEVSQEPTKNGEAELDRHVIPVYTEGTVLDAMEAYRDISGTFTFTSKQYPGLGVFIDSVQGSAAADGKYWILYIHGETADLGASRAQVFPGDSVEWRYEPSFY